MPTYDYVCSQCGHELEIFHSMSDAPKRKCPACGKNKLQRRIGAGAGILFKGTGFYQTDYRSASYEASAKGERDESSSTKSDAKPAETKGEAKSETKSDTKEGTSKPKPEPTPKKPKAS